VQHALGAIVLDDDRLIFLGVEVEFLGVFLVLEPDLVEAVAAF